MRSAEVCVTEVGTTEICMVKTSCTQHRLVKICSPKFRPLEVHSAEHSSMKVCSHEIRLDFRVLFLHVFQVLTPPCLSISRCCWFAKLVPSLTLIECPLF